MRSRSELATILHAEQPAECRRLVRRRLGGSAARLGRLPEERGQYLCKYSNSKYIHSKYIQVSLAIVSLVIVSLVIVCLVIVCLVRARAAPGWSRGAALLTILAMAILILTKGSTRLE